MADGKTGLPENVAALLSYVLFWITGIIFFLIDKRPFVRYHAAQSMVVFGGLHIVRYVLATSLDIAWSFGGPFSVGFALLSLLQLLGLVLWIVLMVKAYQGDRFKVPIAGNLAESFVRRSA